MVQKINRYEISKSLIVKIIFSIIVISGMSFTASAQNPKKIIKLYQNQQYDKVVGLCLKVKRNSNFKIPADYYRYLSILQTPKQANQISVLHLTARLDRHFLSAPKSKYTIWNKKYQCDSLVYIKNRNKYLNRLVDRVIETESFDKAEQYISIYKELKSNTKLKLFVDSFSYRLLMKQSNRQAYQDYLEKYPNSIFFAQVKFAYDSVWWDIYSHFQREGDWETLQLFHQKFLRFPFPDTLKKDMQLALLAKDLKLNKSYNPQNHSKYIQYLKTAKTDLRILVLQKLMQKDLDQKNYLQAFDTLVKYHQYLNDLPQMMKTARVIKHYPQKVIINKLPNTINTQNYEYSPVISADGNTLYFCSMNRHLGEDIYFSQKKNGQWQKSRKLQGINTRDGNEAPESVSADQSMLFIYSGKNGGDISYSEKGLNAWNTPKSIEKLQTPYFEGDASLSANANILVFASDRLENYGLYHKKNRPFHGNLWGNTDIYIAFKNPDGKWDSIIHLNKVINTPYAELSPFLHPDMKTLYFSSNGHGGLGGLDVFKTTRLYDTSWVYWSEPQSLGKEINTTGDDWGFKITTDGQKAYFAREDSLSFDIYEAVLPESAKPKPVVSVNGCLPFEPSWETKIYWIDTWQNSVGEFKPTNKNFQFFVPPGNYIFYLETSNQYIPPVFTTIIKNTALKFIPQKIETGEHFLLQNIYFNFNEYILQAKSLPELNHLLRFLQKNPELKIQIIGYTDAVGSEKDNLELSKKRAKAIVNYLVMHRITVSRLSYTGLGEQLQFKPSNKAEKLNRRVEFVILDKK